MGRNKKWNGYSSWSYLTPNLDYDVVKLEKQVNRVPKYDFGLTKDQEAHVEKIIEENLIIDLHEHINVFPEGYPVKTQFMPKRQFKAFEGLASSGVDVVFDNCVCSTFDSAVNWVGMSMADYEHQDFVIPARRFEDLERAFKDGKVAVVSTFEQASAIDRDVDKVDLLFGLGIRSMGIVYSESNTLGSGLSELRDGGLTNLGYDAVKRMNKTGIIVDVSHAGAKTAMDAIEASNKPVLISHCGSRTLTFNVRMLPDEVLEVCAEKEGVVGVETAGFAPRTKKHPDASIECLMEHLEYLIDLLGADHVGVGPDTLYGDHAAMYRNGPVGTVRPRGADGHFKRERPKDLPDEFNHTEMVRDLDYVKGLESPSDFTNVIRGLVRDGYSDVVIKKVMGQNALRLIKKCWPL
jgi:membrane dipeptidase